CTTSASKACTTSASKACTTSASKACTTPAFALAGAATAATSSAIVRGSCLTCSPHGVDDHGAVNAMSVPRFLTEERRRVVIGPHTNESIIAAKAPAAVRRVPLEAAAN